MTQQIQTPAQAEATATEVVNAIRAVLSGDARTQGTLKADWDFLQLYSFWGMRLPYREESLKIALKTDNTGYRFFRPMLTEYATIHDACDHFLTRVFPGVVGLGNNLKSFARESDADGGFASVKILLDQAGGRKTPEEKEAATSALVLLADLAEKAKKNADDAKRVGENLAVFKGKLSEAQNGLNKVAGLIEEDNKTSMATIEKLVGGTTAIPAGTIAETQRAIEAANKEYEQNVAVAATTPTYAWIGPGFGLIAAVVVAGVYGSRATEALKKFYSLQARLETDRRELATAYATHSVHAGASRSVAEAIHFTDLALEKTTRIQNAWNGLGNQLNDLHDDLARTFTSNDGEKQLKAIAVVSVYLRRASSEWSQLKDPLKQLTAEPYIQVEAGDYQVVERDGKMQLVPAARRLSA